MTLNESVGRNLRTLREKAALSQARLAEMLRGFHGLAWQQPTVALIESGQRPVSIDEAIVVAAFFRVGVAALIRPSGSIELMNGAVVAGDDLWRFIRSGSGAELIVPPGRSKHAISWNDLFQVIEDGIEEEAKAFARLGGDPDALRAARRRLYDPAGGWTRQAYAGWKSAELRKLRRKKVRR